MEVINLSKKKIIPIVLNGLECVAVLDNTTIAHFERSNKIGFLKALERMENNEFEVIKNLIGSIIREKETNRILGRKYFNQYDDFELITFMTPVIKNLLPNLPEANGVKEKK